MFSQMPAHHFTKLRIPLEISVGGHQLGLFKYKSGHRRSNVIKRKQITVDCRYMKRVFHRGIIKVPPELGPGQKIIVPVLPSGTGFLRRMRPIRHKTALTLAAQNMSVALQIVIGFAYRYLADF
ncbi:hypothetical protein D3C75_877880 [compost metagenome]